MRDAAKLFHDSAGIGPQGLHAGLVTDLDQIAGHKMASCTRCTISGLAE
jgi:hypothetical protein